MNCGKTGLIGISIFKLQIQPSQDAYSTLFLNLSPPHVHSPTPFYLSSQKPFTRHEGYKKVTEFTGVNVVSWLILNKRAPRLSLPSSLCTHITGISPSDGHIGRSVLLQQQVIFEQLIGFPNVVSGLQIIPLSTVNFFYSL